MASFSKQAEINAGIQRDKRVLATSLPTNQNRVRRGSSDQLATRKSDAADEFAMGSREKYLGSTHSDKRGMMGQKLEYPLHNKGEYPARIIFSVIPNVTPSVAGLATDLVTISAKTINDGVETLSKKDIVKSSEAAAAEVIRVSQEGSSGMGGAQFDKAYNKAKSAAANVAKKVALFGTASELPHYDDRDDKTSHKISLYLPRGISVSDGVTYNSAMQLGFIGGLAENAMNKGVNVLGSTVAGAAGMAIAEFNSFRKGSGMASGMAEILAQRRLAKMSISPTAQAAGAGMQAATKVTTNKNTRTFFQDVPMRSFGFNFSLIPTSESEAKEIEKIVKLFRTELYPEVMAVDEIRVGYRFPNRFKIRLKNGADKIGLKFLPVYMTNFTAVYNSNSPMMHVDSRFNQVDISMSFTEDRPMTKADVRDGGY